MITAYRSCQNPWPWNLLLQFTAEDTEEEQQSPKTAKSTRHPLKSRSKRLLSKKTERKEQPAKRKKLKNKDLPKNLKINWDDEDADDDKGADDKDTDRAGEAEDSQKSVPMVWDRTLKQYVPIRKDDGGSWRDH